MKDFGKPTILAAGVKIHTITPNRNAELHILLAPCPEWVVHFNSRRLAMEDMLLTVEGLIKLRVQYRAWCKDQGLTMNAVMMPSHIFRQWIGTFQIRSQLPEDIEHFHEAAFNNLLIAS